MARYLHFALWRPSTAYFRDFLTASEASCRFPARCGWACNSTRGPPLVPHSGRVRSCVPASALAPSRGARTFCYVSVTPVFHTPVTLCNIHHTHITLAMWPLRLSDHFFIPDERSVCVPAWGRAPVEWWCPRGLLFWAGYSSAPMRFCGRSRIPVCLTAFAAAGWSGEKYRQYPPAPRPFTA